MKVNEWWPTIGQAVEWDGEPCRIEGVVKNLKRNEDGILLALVKWEDENQGTEWVSTASLAKSTE